MKPGLVITHDVCDACDAPQTPSPAFARDSRTRVSGLDCGSCDSQPLRVSNQTIAVQFPAAHCCACLRRSTGVLHVHSCFIFKRQGMHAEIKDDAVHTNHDDVHVNLPHRLK